MIISFKQSWLEDFWNSGSHKRVHAELRQWAISVNGPWRLCFIFKDGDVYALELVQYH